MNIDNYFYLMDIHLSILRHIMAIARSGFPIGQLFNSKSGFHTLNLKQRPFVFVRNNGVVMRRFVRRNGGLAETVSVGVVHGPF